MRPPGDSDLFEGHGNMIGMRSIGAGRESRPPNLPISCTGEPPRGVERSQSGIVGSTAPVPVFASARELAGELVAAAHRDRAEAEFGRPGVGGLRRFSLTRARSKSASLLPPQIRTARRRTGRSEEHTSELQSRENLVCRLLLEK